MAKFTDIETITPADVEGKVLVIKTGAKHVDAAAVTKELLRVFPNLSPTQILIMPDYFEMKSVPRGELVAQMRAIVRRFQIG